MKTALPAQTFNGTGGLLVPPGAPAQTTGTTQSSCSVSGVGVLGGCAQIDNVTINLNHTWDGELGLFLIGPSGQVLELSTGNGGPNDNYLNTVFKDAAPVFITAGAPPFTGTFRPEGRQVSLTPPWPNAAPLGTFTFANTFNGTNADGDWTLYIHDFLGADWGTLNSWSISFTGGGTGNTVTLAATPAQVCPGTTGSASLALSFSGPTPPGVNYDVTIARSPGANLVFNDIVPTGLTWTATIPIPSVTTTYTLTSIVASSGCQPAIGTPATATITVLTPVAAAITGDLLICAGQNTELSATGGGNYLWSTGSTADAITVMPAANQSYSVTVTSDEGCTATATAAVVVKPVPTIVLTAPPLVCDGGCQTVTATMTGTPPFDFSYEFQVNGTFAGPGGFGGPSGSPIQFQACPPAGSGPAVQVVVCTLSDQNCSL